MFHGGFAVVQLGHISIDDVNFVLVHLEAFIPTFDSRFLTGLKGSMLRLKVEKQDHHFYTQNNDRWLISYIPQAEVAVKILINNHNLVTFDRMTKVTS